MIVNAATGHLLIRLVQNSDPLEQLVAIEMDRILLSLFLMLSCTSSVYCKASSRTGSIKKKKAQFERFVGGMLCVGMFHLVAHPGSGDGESSF